MVVKLVRVEPVVLPGGVGSTITCYKCGRSMVIDSLFCKHTIAFDCIHCEVEDIDGFWCYTEICSFCGGKIVKKCECEDSDCEVCRETLSLCNERCSSCGRENTCTDTCESPEED